MDFLNANFVSLRDLDSIDDKLNLLSDQKLRISKAIESAIGSPSPETSDEEKLYIEGLLQSIQQLSKAGTEQIVDNLIDNNGSLQVLVDLKEAVAEKLVLESENAILQEAALVETTLLTLEKTPLIEELIDISQSIEKFKGTHVGHTLAEELENIMKTRKVSLLSQLEELLELIKWLAPKENVSIPSSTLKSISKTFSELIDLQMVELAPEYPNCWWGLEALLRPFTIRFNYHFGQSNETNKISRPEWALQFVEAFLHDNMSVIEMVIGTSFRKHLRIGVMEVLTAILIPVREKLQRMVHVINENIEKSDDNTSLERNGRLLSHLIFETTSFDQRLRNAFKYNPYISDFNKTPTRKWMGLTGDILLANNDESRAVTNWLNLELQLAKQRFDTEIINALNAFDIDFEYNASSIHPNDVLRPSYSAFALVKLFDNLTSHFKTLTIVKYQLKYVSNIQLTFLDEYLEALQNQFKQFNESLSLKLISNFLPGSVKSDTGLSVQSVISNGRKGLEILTGLYCLIKFVIDNMQEWSEELLFIQLWNFYRSVSPKEEKEESIFGYCIVQYTDLLNKVATKYSDFFKREIRTAFKDYVNSCTWVIEDTPSTPSTQLSNLTTIIPAYMSYLQRTLPEIDYFLVASKVCDSFATVVQEYVITNNQFNKNGLSQLELDIAYLAEYLEGPLLMDPQCKYSNKGNMNYNKVLQSIEMMQHFDGSTARMMKRDVDSTGTIRSQFENGLDCLSDNDIRDLLFRIV